MKPIYVETDQICGENREKRPPRAAKAKGKENQLGLDIDMSDKIKPHQWEKLPWRRVMEGRIPNYV